MGIYIRANNTWKKIEDMSDSFTSNNDNDIYVKIPGDKNPKKIVPTVFSGFVKINNEWKTIFPDKPYLWNFKVEAKDENNNPISGVTISGRSNYMGRNVFDNVEEASSSFVTTGALPNTITFNVPSGYTSQTITPSFDRNARTVTFSDVPSNITITNKVFGNTTYYIFHIKLQKK